MRATTSAVAAIRAGLAMMVIGSCLPARAASVTVSLPTLQATAGAEVKVAIHLRGCQGLGAMQTEMLFDSAVLEFKTADSGPMLAGALVDSSSPAAGRLNLALVAGEPVTGDGEVMTVRFKALGSRGAQTALRIEKARAWEHGNGHEMLVAVEPGAIAVTAAADGRPTGRRPSAAWLWLAVGGVVAILVVAIIVSVRRKPVT